MKLYQVTDGYMLRTHDNRVYRIYMTASILSPSLRVAKADYLCRSETFVINGVLLKDIPNHIKSIVFQLNKKP